MTPGAEGTLLRRLLASLYRLGLLRYPTRLRRRHGAEMVSAFERLLEEEGAAHGMFGVVRLVAHMLMDLLRPLPRQLGDDARTSSKGFLLGAVGTALRSLRRAPGFTALLVGVLSVAVR